MIFLRASGYINIGICRFLLSRFLFLIVWSFLLLACTNGEMQKQAHFDRGLEYLRDGKLTEAEQEFRNALKIDNNFTIARYKLGQLYLDTGEYGKAFEEFKKVSELDQDNYDAHLKTAEFYLLQNKLKESREFVNRIIEQYPSHAGALAVLSNIELKSGNNHRAELAVEKAIALDPEVDTYYILRAQILYNKKIYRLAESDLLKAIELNPKNFGAYKLLVSYYMHQDMHEKALELLTKTLGIFPNSPEPLLELASYHFTKDEFHRGEKAIRKAISFNRSSIQTYFRAADIYKSSNMYDNAESVLREALSVSNNPYPIMERLADICFAQKKYEVAEDIVETLLKQDGSLPIARLTKSKLLIKQGEAIEAVKLLKSLINQYPDWGEAYFQLSLAELKAGNIESSKDFADKAVKFLKKDSRAHALLAQHHLQKRDFFRTELEAHAALSLNPQNINAAIILGQSYLYTQRIEHALELFEEINKMLPDNTDILYNLSLTKIARQEIPEGMVLLEHVLKLDPGYTPALAKIAEIYISNNKVVNAISRLQRHVDDYPGNSDHLLLLGELYFKEGEITQAEKTFLQLQKKEPGEPRSYIVLAAIQEINNNIDSALNEYRKLIRISPKSKTALMGYAALLERSGNIAEARKKYRAILQIDSAFAPAANNLSWLIMNDKNADVTEALRLAKLAKKIQPNSPDISDTLGYAYYLGGSYELATMQFRNAVALLPQDPRLRYHLALSLKAQKADSDALQELRKCLEMDIDFPLRNEAQILLEKWVNG